MSDLEDIDLEHEELHLEEDETQTEEASEQSETPPPKTGVLIKIVIAVVLAGGAAAYFALSHHSTPRAQTGKVFIAPPPEHVAAHSPAPLDVVNNIVPSTPPSKNSGTADPLTWNGAPKAAAVPSPAAVPAVASVPVVTAPSSSAAMMPEAIPAAPSGAITSPAPMPPLSSPQPTLASPPIVNDLPPPATSLTNAGAMPGMPPLAPAAAPSAPHTTMTVQTPAAMPIPAPPKSAETAVASVAVSPVQQTQPPAKELALVKSSAPMPAMTVPAVDKTEIGKSSPENAKQEVNPEQEAKVKALEKTIADLKKTIDQLQQAAVVKSDVTEKPAEEVAVAAPAPVEGPKKAHHKKTSSHPAVSHHKSGNVVTTKWQLKAAKPGVAWVARKDSDELQMVEPGDLLSGVGTITAIVRDSSGNWVVNGTKGRIVQ